MPRLAHEGRVDGLGRFLSIGCGGGRGRAGVYLHEPTVTLTHLLDIKIVELTSRIK
jgi:hypothetical protein